MSLTLKETAQELGLDLFVVVEMVSRGELKPFSQHGRTYFSEQDILEYQTLQPSRKQFRKFAARCDGEELEEVIEVLLRHRKFKRLLTPELNYNFWEKNLESKHYEALCQQFQNDDGWYEKITDRFAEDEPYAAAIYSLRNEDILLFNKAAGRLNPRELLQVYKQSRKVHSELGRYIRGTLLESLEEHIQELQEEAVRLGLQPPKFKSLRFNSEGSTAQYRQLLTEVKSLKLAVENHFGLKLPDEISFSEPEGRYASIRYEPEEGYANCA